LLPWRQIHSGFQKKGEDFLVVATETNPVLANSQVKIKSKRIMARFLLRYLSSETPLKLLRLFGEGLSPSEIAEKTSFSKQRVQYWVNLFLRDKLIYEFADGKPRFFDLTAFGKKVLTTSERGVKEPLLMESYDVKYRLLQTNLKHDCSRCLEKSCSLPKSGTTNNCVIAWERLGDPKNWQKWGFKYCGIRVERNDGLFPTVVIRSGELSGFSPYELVAEAGTILALVRAKLRDLGLVLDDVGVPLHEPTFHTYTEEAEILNKQGVVYTPGGHIDDSPLRNPVEQGSRISHEERNFAQQVDYMSLPKLVRELESKIDKQHGEISSLREENRDVKESLASYVKASTGFVQEITRRQEETTRQYTEAMQQFTAYLQEVSAPKGQAPKRLYE
jgi:hypothetical protein